MKLHMDSGKRDRHSLHDVSEHLIVSNCNFSVNTHLLFESVPDNTEVCSPNERTQELLVTKFGINVYLQVSHTRACKHTREHIRAHPKHTWPWTQANTCTQTHACHTLCKATQLQLGAVVTPRWHCTASVALARRCSSVTASGSPNTSWNQAPPIITWKTWGMCERSPPQSFSNHFSLTLMENVLSSRKGFLRIFEKQLLCWQNLTHSHQAE